MNYEPESEWLIENGFLWTHSGGTYVDLGCAHPTRHSLTDFVRRLGWKGVAIDGNPDYAKDWQDSGFPDHFVCEVLSDKIAARFCIHENSQTSRISDSPSTDQPERWGIKNISTYTCLPLNFILEERGIGKIDLLTLDIEGMEARVLATLDFKKHSPEFIISEFVTQGAVTDPAVCQMLLGIGYEVVWMTGSNLIFRRKL